MLLHDHDYLTVSLLLSGELIEHTNKGTKVVKPGSVLIKPPSIMHGDIFTKDSSILSLKLFNFQYYNFNWNSWEIIEQSGLLKQFINVLHHKDRKHALAELKHSLISMSNQKKFKRAVPEKIKQVK